MNDREPHRILVAGVGNIFLGDDGFGVEVVSRFAARERRNAVTVIDFGTRGFDLACALLDGYAAAILIDAIPRGGTPGTLYVMLAEKSEATETGNTDGHRLSPTHALALAARMGKPAEKVFIVGCEPGGVDCSREQRVGLSEAVSAAVPKAVELVEGLVAKLQTNGVAEELIGLIA